MTNERNVRPSRAEATRGLLLLASVFGLFWWAWFLVWGKFLGAQFDWFTVEDWLSALRAALVARELPLYMAGSPYYESAAESLLWAHPIAPLFPSVVFLWAGLSVKQAAVAVILLFYVGGCGGVWMLARRYALRPVPALLLFVLTLGNGFLISRLGVWHQWAGLFLLPWVAYFTFAALEGERTLRTACGLAGVLAAICWNGYLVPPIIVAFYVGLLACDLRMVRWVVTVGVLTAGFAAGRLLPVVVMWPRTPRMMFGGYESWWQLWMGLTSHVEARIFWWEYDGYVGACAAVFVAVWGIAVSFGQREWRRRHSVVLLACAVMTCWAMTRSVLPIGGVLDYVWLGEHSMLFRFNRVPARLLVVSFTMLAISACLALNARMARRWDLLGVLLLGVTLVGLHTHARLYRQHMSVIGKAPDSGQSYLVHAPATPYTRMTPSGEAIVHDTSRYRWSIVWGLGISGLTVVAMWGSLRRRRRSGSDRERVWRIDAQKVLRWVEKVRGGRHEGE